MASSYNRRELSRMAESVLTIGFIVIVGLPIAWFIGCYIAAHALGRDRLVRYALVGAAVLAC